MSKSNPTIFFERPISLALLLAAFGLIALLFAGRRRAAAAALKKREEP